MIFILAANLRDAMQWAGFHLTRHDRWIYVDAPVTIRLNSSPGDEFVRTALFLEHPLAREIDIEASQ